MSRRYKPLIQLYNKGDDSDANGVVGYTNDWGKLDKTHGLLYKMDILSDCISKLDGLAARLNKEYHRELEKDRK